MFIVWIVIAVLAALALVGIGIYNGLISGRQEVRSAWSQIDVQLKRRHDLIPNLVNTVKGAMEAEKGQLSAVMEARNRAASATSPQQAIQAENALTRALGGLMAVVEAYPQLRSQENVKMLMEELRNTENMIAFSRQHYNDAVQDQNVRIASFPGVLVAQYCHIGAETMFQVPEGERAAVEAVPQVQF